MSQNQQTNELGQAPELWDSADIAKYLGMNVEHVRRIAAKNPHFPRPIRLTRRSKQFWVRTEVVEWLLKQRR